MMKLLNLNLKPETMLELNLDKTIFQKGYSQKFSSEIFLIDTKKVKFLFFEQNGKLLKRHQMV